MFGFAWLRCCFGSRQKTRKPRDVLTSFDVDLEAGLVDVPRASCPATPTPKPDLTPAPAPEPMLEEVLPEMIPLPEDDDEDLEVRTGSVPLPEDADEDLEVRPELVPLPDDDLEVRPETVPLPEDDGVWDEVVGGGAAAAGGSATMDDDSPRQRALEGMLGEDGWGSGEPVLKKGLMIDKAIAEVTDTGEVDEDDSWDARSKSEQKDNDKTEATVEYDEDKDVYDYSRFGAEMFYEAGEDPLPEFNYNAEVLMSYKPGPPLLPKIVSHGSDTFDLHLTTALPSEVSLAELPLSAGNSVYFDAEDLLAVPSAADIGLLLAPVIPEVARFPSWVDDHEDQGDHEEFHAASLVTDAGLLHAPVILEIAQFPDWVDDDEDEDVHEESHAQDLLAASPVTDTSLLLAPIIPRVQQFPDWADDDDDDDEFFDSIDNSFTASSESCTPEFDVTGVDGDPPKLGPIEDRLAPALDVESLPPSPATTLSQLSPDPSEPYTPTLVGSDIDEEDAQALKATPLKKASVISYAGYPYLSPTHAIGDATKTPLPNGGMRCGVVVHRAPVIVPMRAEIVRVFGDESEVDFQFPGAFSHNSDESAEDIGGDSIERHKQSSGPVARIKGWATRRLRRAL